MQTTTDTDAAGPTATDKRSSEHSESERQAIAQYESICELLEALEQPEEPDAPEEPDPMDYPDGEESEEYQDNLMAYEDALAEYEEELEAFEDFDEDEARENILANALDIQVRSAWQTPGEGLEAAEYTILLCTGGPAVRITGELDRWNQPDSARLEHQDWFVPWSEVFTGVDRSVLLEYAQHFYFGE